MTVLRQVLLAAFAMGAVSSFAVPLRADAILNFSTINSTCVASSTSCGVIGLSGSPGTVTSLSIADFTGFTELVGGVLSSWAVTNATLTWNGSTTAPSYVFGGTISCSTASFCGTTSVTDSDLFSFTAAAPTASATLTSYSFGVSTATSLTASTVFLNALRLTVPTGLPVASVTGTTVNNTNDGTAGDYAVGASATMALTLTGSVDPPPPHTPEPGTWLLLVTGLFGLTCLSRHHRRKLAKST